jgi:hypothetical protein
MADTQSLDKHQAGEDALERVSVAPPSETPETPEVREATDAEHHKALKRDPTHADSKLEIELDASFPTSDPPASVQPGHADPAPSSGFDEEAEAAIAEERAAAAK